MKFCSNCGAQMADSELICPNCNTPAPNPYTSNGPADTPEPVAPTGPSIPSTPPVSPAQPYSYGSASTSYNTAYNSAGAQQPSYSYGAPTPPANDPYGLAPSGNKPDEKSVGLNILGFFFPLVGLIMYCVMKSDRPKRAKSIGKSALGGFITNFVLSIITIILSFTMIGAIRDAAIEAGLADDSSYSYSYEWNVDSDDANDIETPATSDSADAGNAAGSVNVGTLDWNNVQIAVDGVSITLPCSYADFVSKTGYEFEDSTDAASTLDDNEYMLFSNCVKGDKVLEIEVYNPGGGSKAATDCQVVGVRVDSDAYSGSPANVTFPGNISLGSSVSQSSLTELFGEPDYVYESDLGDSDYMSWSWSDENDAYNDYEIVAYDGTSASSISIECFGD